MKSFLTKHRSKSSLSLIEWKKTSYNSFPNQKFLTDLIPYDLNKKTKANLRTGLKEYLMLLEISLHAINALKENHIDKFDALVGENACQIRAVWISIIASKNQIDIEQLKNIVNKIKVKINNLLSEKSISQLMQNGISMMKLLQQENLLIPL